MGWDERKGRTEGQEGTMNESEIFLPGKLSERKTQLACLGVRLETRGREWGMQRCPWAL